MKRTSRVLITTAVCIALLSVAGDAATIYAALGGQNGISTDSGSLATINPTTGAVTVIGTPMPEH